MDSYTLFATAGTIVAGTVTFLILRSGMQKKSGGVSVPKAKPLDVSGSGEDLEEFSYEKLKMYTGEDESKPLLLGAKGRVFDVSPGKDFYGPGGPYAAFAGHDATVALAKMKVDSTLVNVPKPTASLSLSERDILHDWVSKFEQKYKVVGKLVGTGE
mmetsp:Transcript_15711/g.34045  ORF Transcript_15711/g.34045 Transcript_15711/m.34045 type:complete len:157 (-) Transcript_15711:204-674(-)|eukprot:CAMPEP_0118935214 /NCGR_PEP_ID=MMETSP1169-20130426/15161_1 /TAXON_ID=36882 /ORGANISM="Pyramimonas obovata, Strain CCMP722" /LENGTH=156 /DNA_ID=CAMNT_0006878211 /DNA_START=197 /DNA_END=667 /DNA_ORIENTATION=+